VIEQSKEVIAADASSTDEAVAATESEHSDATTELGTANVTTETDAVIPEADATYGTSATTE